MDCSRFPGCDTSNGPAGVLECATRAVSCVRPPGQTLVYPRIGTSILDARPRSGLRSGVRDWERGEAQRLSLECMQ